MGLNQFDQVFWSAEFNATTGFEHLSRRLKDGRTTYKELEEFIKLRAKIEDDYSKALTKLAKFSVGTCETSGLKRALNELVTQAEEAGKKHQALSMELNKQAEGIRTLVENCSKQRKEPEETVKRNQTEKKDLYKKMVDLKTIYQKKSAAYEAARSNLDTAKNVGEDPTKAAKEKEKASQKYNKAHEEKSKADDAYKDSTLRLEAIRVKWEKSHEEYAQLAEQIDSERIVMQLQQAWVYLNYISQSLLDHDETNEEVRKKIEQVDVREDIETFITSKQTGSQRPVAMPYECFDSRPTQPRPPVSLPKIPHPHPIPFRPSALPNNKDSFDSDPTYAAIQ